MTAREPANVLHCGGSSPSVAWSTINAGEAIPGVVTTLTWSLFGERTERGLRGAFCDLGVLTEAHTVRPDNPDERVWDIFFGRAAANLETFRALADRMPGTSGDAMESQLFGTVRPGVSSRTQFRRYPVVAAKAPMAMWGVAAELDRAGEHIAEWWRKSITATPTMTADQARANLDAAARKFAGVMRPHVLAAMLCQALYEQVRAAAERVGKPGLEIALVTGYGDMAETAYVVDLWDVSRGGLSLDEFVARHGYHGPNEGELAARIWRLDRAPLEKLLRQYADLTDAQSPRAIEAARTDERLLAEQELLAASARTQRTAAAIVLKTAARFIPLRGTGKAAFLQCVDVVRATALRLGELHTESGALNASNDVFHLTLEELAAPVLPAGVGDLVAERGALHERYKGFELPEFWEGAPVPFVPEKVVPAAAGETVVVTGIPVTPGVVTGRARVVRDPETDDGPEAGEILVCRTTDPSWAAVLIISAALVIDIGGPISHGAIVARELGIPCVIGTRDGTTKIADGDLIEVDGSAGTVTVLRSVADDVDGSGSEVSTTGSPCRLLSILPMPDEVVLGVLGDLADRTKLTLLPSSTVPQLHAALADAEILLGAWQSAGAAHVDTAAVDAAGPDLVFVQQPSAGVDVLDVPALTARGVPVANAAGANARGVAEWAVAAALALSRSIPFADAGVRAGGWPQMDVVRRGHGEIGGLRIGVLGFGPVGSVTASLFAAFGCEVAYWSRTPRPDVPYAHLEPVALCRRSDIVVLALPLNPDTRDIVSTELLAAMPAGAYLINVGRAGTLDHPALLAALESGHLGGAALDVFLTEPLPAGDPLRDNDRILLSPHAAGATRQSVARIMEKSVANLRRALDGEPVIDVVNSLDPVIRRRA